MIYSEEEDDEEEIGKITWHSGEKFDSVTVWGHHAIPDNVNDHWIRGIDEWVIMAEMASAS